jgi:hypothetical protein
MRHDHNSQTACGYIVKFASRFWIHTGRYKVQSAILEMQIGGVVLYSRLSPTAARVGIPITNVSQPQNLASYSALGL